MEEISKEQGIEELNEIVGLDLKDMAANYNIIIRKDGNINKGWAGLTLERVLGKPLDCTPAADFGSWELKSIPLKYLKNGEITFKETMAIVMVNKQEVLDHEFEDSRLYGKLKSFVVVTRLTEKNDPTDSNIVHSVNSVELTGKLFDQAKADYDLIRNVIREGGDLHSNMGVYIQPRTKGSGRGSTTRAFYARKDFLKKIILL